ncbi:DNA primase small subunit-like [Sphaerodactylus townsendi]|uniref:DNA primase small subunit-like n=1 Tax=Sphaerodactylus townsendi TaxID=933632 RepID=UPI0020265B8F|nr:DNA primase small subunit-like [Sphaerodactylus townsendi]
MHRMTLLCLMELWPKRLPVLQKNYFQRQEFSFTLHDDIYVQYQSFSTPQELEKEIQKICLYKIDIGAVYSHRAQTKNLEAVGKVILTEAPRNAC